MKNAKPVWAGWTPENAERARGLFFDMGQPASAISALLGCSRNAVVGKMASDYGKLRPDDARERQLRSRAQYQDVSLQNKLTIKAKKPKPSPRPPKPRPAPFVVMTASEGGVTLMRLTARTCRFPIGDPQDAGFHFCGAVTTIEEPYCPACRKLAYQERKPARLMQLARIV